MHTRRHTEPRTGLVRRRGPHGRWSAPACWVAVAALVALVLIANHHQAQRTPDPIAPPPSSTAGT
ncbi:hypothetical protein [Streptomyces sp. NPDC048606]|uniref:hypothetical protein n=1 Tax=Streptomyces sp. NPDC048606 TaxID=3154726 RepID=UPI00341B8C55